MRAALRRAVRDTFSPFTERRHVKRQAEPVALSAASHALRHRPTCTPANGVTRGVIVRRVENDGVCRGDRFWHSSRLSHKLLVVFGYLTSSLAAAHLAVPAACSTANTDRLKQN